MTRGRVRALIGGGSGHFGSSLSLVEFLRALYEGVLNVRGNSIATIGTAIGASATVATAVAAVGALAKTFAAHYGLADGDHLLDIGCAKGFLPYELTQAPGVRISGLDISA